MEDGSALEAALNLLAQQRFHDVRFNCKDGVSVGCNRAFLAARCEYFDKLLYGGLLEGGSAEISLPGAPSAAVKHVLHYLHTSSFTAIDEEACWVTMLETGSLAQQYMLPRLLQHIAGRLLEDLPAEHLGLALSFALKAQLQVAIRNIWVALPRLLQQPLVFDSTFSAEAICLCLQHTCWMSGPLKALDTGPSGTWSSPVPSGQQARPGSAGGTADAGTNCDNTSSKGDSISSVSAREAEAYNTVVAWMLAEVEHCSECQLSRKQHDADTTAGIDHAAHSSAASACSCTTRLLNTPPPQQQQQQQQHGLVVEVSEQPQEPNMLTSPVHVSSSSAVHPAGWTASGSASSSSIRTITSPFKAANSSGAYSASGTAAAGMSRSSSADSAAASEATAQPPATSERRDSNPASSSASEHPAAANSNSTTVDRSCSGAQCCMLSAASAPASMCGSGAAGVAAAQQHGHCCAHHEAVLLQLLARLNWHVLAPSALEQLEALGLLSPAALLDIYRALQRCSHVALHGSFPACLTAKVRRQGGGEQGRLRCYTAGGEQVLDCDSPAHITATANLSFTSGKHCWQYVVLTPCDLVWIGLGDGSLSPDVWGGKQSGGWFYGSNDALCHDKHTDKHAYDHHCGHGPWGTGAVIDVCLDMDAREVWFGVDGGPLRLGFTELPGRVYPAVSLRAPGQLLVRFRAASWLMAAA